MESFSVNSSRSSINDDLLISKEEESVSSVLDMEKTSLESTSQIVSNVNISLSEKPIKRGIHANDICKQSSLRRTLKKEDRLSFIEFMFEEFKTIEKTSKKSMAKRISDKYKELHPDLKLNEVWVYRLILAGIYKDENDHYGFDNVECDFDAMLSKPSLLDMALNNKK